MTDDIIGTLKRLEKAHKKVEYHRKSLEVKVNKICDFNAYVTYCAGDGFLIGNDNRIQSVAVMSCLIGKSKKNKLTTKDHLKYCI